MTYMIEETAKNRYNMEFYVYDIINSNHPKEFNNILKSIIHSGIHKGKSIEEVLDTDPEYILKEIHISKRFEIYIKEYIHCRVCLKAPSLQSWKEFINKHLKV